MNAQAGKREGQQKRQKTRFHFKFLFFISFYYFEFNFLLHVVFWSWKSRKDGGGTDVSILPQQKPYPKNTG